MLSFKPIAESEARGIPPAGTYDFQVLFADQVVSKTSGNPMIKLKLGLFDPETGKIRWHVHDYLVAAFESRLRHFCDATGLLAKYEEGKLSSDDCKERTGKVRIVIRNEPDYGDSAKVDDYVCRKPKPISTPGTAPSEDQDDRPF